MLVPAKFVCPSVFLKARCLAFIYSAFQMGALITMGLARLWFIVQFIYSKENFGMIHWAIILISVCLRASFWSNNTAVFTLVLRFTNEIAFTWKKTCSCGKPTSFVFQKEKSSFWEPDHLHKRRIKSCWFWLDNIVIWIQTFWQKPVTSWKDGIF